MEALFVGSVERDQLKKMAIRLYPEYPYISIGGDYVSMTTSKHIKLDVDWNRIHWLELVIRGFIKRIAVTAGYDRAWLLDMVGKITLALIAPQVKHPITLVYEEFIKVFPDTKDNEMKKAG